MKIFLDIQSKYTEPELHICADKKTREITTLKDSIEKLFITKLTAHKNHETTLLSAMEIVRIYSENKRVYARTYKDTYEVRERLYNLEEQLRERGFVRISNSEIVKISSIEKLDMGYTGTIKIYMSNGDETYVSRRYVSRIREVLG